ncbi:MAG: hypothetical protein AB7F49_32185 [Pseudorhodoplanes sp.]
MRPKSRLLLFGCPINVIAAGIAVDFGQRFAAPEFSEAAEAGLRTLWARLRMHSVAIVDCKNIGNQDVFDVLLFAERPVLLSEVLDELSFGCSNIISSASSDDLAVSVEDMICPL